MADYLNAIKKINSLVFSVYNICAKGLFALRYPFLRNVLKLNKQYKNKHRGERCFILGLGPSLKEVDLNILNNETLFVVNDFVNFDTEQMLNPLYYFLIDHAYYTDHITNAKDYMRKYPNTQFFMNIKARKKLIRNGLDNINYLYYRYIQHKNYIKFNASKNMTAGMNVIHQCIQLALYMGFSEIVLLGCDLNYLATRFVQMHSYEEDVKYDLRGEDPNAQKLSDSLIRLAAAFSHHDALQEKAKKLGVKIYNTSMNSYIMSYEFRDIKSISRGAEK